MTDGSLTETLRETLALFEGGGAPLTTTEVADRLDLGRRSTYERLERLVEQEQLETKKVGASGRVWWRPSRSADAFQRDLERTERRFEAVFEDPNILVGLLEPDGTVIDINGTAMEYIDTDLEAVTGEPFWETPWWGEGEEIRAEVREWTERAAAGEYVDFEADLVQPTGAQYTVEGVFRPVTDEDGEVVSIIVSDRDVTERKTRERELEETEQRYRTLVEHFPNGAVALVDEDLRYVTFGGTPEGDTDVTRDDLENAPLREALPEEIADVVVPRYEAALDGEVSAFETTIDDGVYQFHFVPVRDDDGEVFAAMGMSQNITERRRAQEDLQQSRERFRALVTASSDTVYRTTPDWSEMHELEGESFDAATNEFRSDWLETYVHLDDRERVRDAIDEAIRTESTFELEHRVEREDGTTGWTFSRAVPMLDENGDIEEWIGMASDITERKRHERALERSEQRYRTLAEQFPNGAVALFDDDLEYTLLAGQAFDHVDPDPEEGIGGSVGEVWGDEVAETLDPLFRDALDGTERTDELSYEGREWAVHAVPVTDEDGAVFAGMAVVRDITEQKEREQYLRDAKSQLEAATEAGAVGTWEWDVQNDEMTVGPSLARTFGVDPEAAQQGVSLDRFIDAIHEDDRERVVAEIERAVETCGEHESEYRVWNAEGDLRWVVARGSVECEDGNPVTFPGALTDITERKRAEIERERTAEQLETLVDILPVGVVVAEADGSVVRTNAAAEEIWGGDVFEVEPVAEHDEYQATWAGTDEPVEPSEWTMSQVLGGAEVTEPNVYEITRFDGEQRVVMQHGMPIRDADGEVTRAVVTLTDITERREYQRKLELSNERLEQFAYAASHDLQEPLRMVTSYLQLLENRYGDTFDEEGEEFLEYAVDGAERMRDMIDGLLAYSRIETRGDPFEPVDLDALLEDVLADLHLKIEERDAEVTVEDLPTVRGDDSQLRQVFQNLLSNALTYNEGPPTVHVDATRRNGEYVVSVEDDGVGIEPDSQDRVFSLFDRLHNREEHAGTGIGLTLCERIVERHGGDIWVDSEPGEGATFSFTLPVERTDG